jgi:hypothetical protein
VVPQPVVPAPEIQQLAQQLTQVAPQPTAPSFELPQGVSDRTKENFDKLTESNRKLLEANQILESELSKRTVAETQMAPITQPAPTQQPDVSQFVDVDPLTGERFVNEVKLQQAIAQANDRALKAEQQIRTYIDTQQQKEVRRQEEEAYQAYPQLKPNDLANFDRDLSKMTQMYALDSMMNPSDYGNRTLSFKEAADLAYKRLHGEQIAAPSAQAQQMTVQPTVNTTNVNTQPTQDNSAQSGIPEQGGMAAEGRPVNVNPQDLTSDLRVLQDKTRKGDMWALAKRLTQVPHTGTPTHGGEGGE